MMIACIARNRTCLNGLAKVVEKAIINLRFKKKQISHSLIKFTNWSKCLYDLSLPSFVLYHSQLFPTENVN